MFINDMQDEKISQKKPAILRNITQKNVVFRGIKKKRRELKKI